MRGPGRSLAAHTVIQCGSPAAPPHPPVLSQCWAHPVSLAGVRGGGRTDPRPDPHPLPFSAAPWRESARCGRPAKAQTPCVRTGAPQPPRLGRPRAPQSGPLPPSPPQPGLGPHRSPSHPLQSPPGVRGPGLAPAGPSPQSKKEGGWGRMGSRRPLPSLGSSWGGWTASSGGPNPSGPRLPTGPQLAAVLGLGLGLLAPVAAALALLLHHRAWRLPPGECAVCPQPGRLPEGVGPLPTSTPLLLPRRK